MATDKKDTIYVDIDDEITGIIEKVRGSDGKIVALVLPKRASVLQSVVNMKLLKRTAENAKKHLVLVTTETGLMPLAGSVGLHVASTPTSKPIIPRAPDAISDEPEDMDEPFDIANSNKNDIAIDEEYDPKAAATTAVGDLAGTVAVSKIAPSAIDEDMELDDDDEPAESAAEIAGAAEVAIKNPKQPKPSKKLRVPNFDNFRKKIVLAVVVLALLVVGWIFAFVVLPKATITIHTDTTSVTTNLNLTLDTNAKTVDTSTGKIVPAVSQASSKSLNQQVPTTGQQNNGTKATGVVRMTTNVCAPNLGTTPSDVPAGTAITNSGNTYITQQNTSFQYNGAANGNCISYKGTGDTPIIAFKGGTTYNTADNVTFAVTSGVSGKGSATGGTDNITKIVTQADIDGAKAKITAQDTTPIKAGLQANLQGKSLLPIPTTFVANDPVVTNSANVGDAADTVTVTEVINYTMLGVKQTDLQTLVDANVNSQIDKGKQVILDDGVAKATFTEQNPATATGASVAIQAKSVAGPEIDTNALKKQLIGKKTGDIKTLVGQNPGVTSVDVKYSPFWVSSVPKNTSKLTVVVDKANTGGQ